VPTIKPKFNGQEGAHRIGRVRSGGLGERTVQTLRLPEITRRSAVMWARRRSSPLKTVFISDIYDEALLWFLDRVAPDAYDAYIAASSRSGERGALWIDSRLLERAEGVAARDGVARNRVLYTAVVVYLKKFGPQISDRAPVSQKRTALK
jgi:hypothetical protein